MTSKERIYTVVKKGEAADRVPWTLNFGSYQSMWPKYMKEYKQSRKITENLFDLLDYDILNVQAPEATGQNGAAGGIGYLSNNIEPEKYYTKAQLSKPGVWVDSWGQLNVPWTEYPDIANVESPLANAQSIQELIDYPFPKLDMASAELCRKDAQAIHEKGKLASADCGGLFGASWYLRGLENYMVDMYEDPEWAMVIADRVTETLIERAKLTAAAGVDVFTYYDDLGTQTGPLLSPAMWREYFKPRWAKVFDAVRSLNPNAIIFMHSCGCVKDFIPDFIDIGLDILHPLQPETMDVYEVAKEYQKDICFWGTISMQKTLNLGTPQDVDNEVKERVERLGKNGHLILSPGNMFTPDTPFENVDALIEAFRKYC